MASFLDFFLIFSIILSNLFLHFSNQITSDANIRELVETTLMATITQNNATIIELIETALVVNNANIIQLVETTLMATTKQNYANSIQLIETTLMAATAQNIIRDIERLQSKEQEGSVIQITYNSFGREIVMVAGKEYNYNGDDWRWAYSEAKVKLDSLQDEISSEIKSFLPQLLGKLQPVTAQNCPLLHPVKTQLESFSQTTAGNNHGQFREILKQLPRDWHVQLADCI